MPISSVEEVRTYGGWRRRRGIGMFGLGTAATFTVVGAVATLVLTAAMSTAALAYVGPPVVVGVALAVVRVSGESVVGLAVQRVRWWWGERQGHTRYQAGIVIDHPRAFQLPGPLAPCTLLSAEDGYGDRYGLVWDRRTGQLTVTLKVVPASTWLADREVADAWVASWGGWLASLGYLPIVKHVTVITDTAPEPGSTLADGVAQSLDPAAPSAAHAILQQLVATAPASAADVDTRVSIAFDPRRAPSAPRDLTEAVAEVGRALEGLESALTSCGVTVLGRASAADLAGAVRIAADPASRGEVNRILAARAARQDITHLGWDDAGPVAAQEFTDRYEHDSGVSVSWSLHQAPRQAVPADVLSRLVAPGRYPKRVALQYRPIAAAAASRMLQHEVEAALFRTHYRRKTGRDETARDEADRARAQQAAAEEASGAGVGLLTVFVTATVTNTDDLPRAMAEVEAAAESSKIRLRRMARSHLAGWATTLPCGICPAEMARRWPT